MMRYASIVDGVVSEIITDDGGAVSERYHPDFLARLVECPADVAPGWAYDGQTFGAPLAAEPPPVDLYAYAADKRWRVETGGITVSGVHVATDDRSKTMIMGARIKSDADPEYTVGWKGADGSFVTLSAPQIIAISDAVLAHVDACFAAEAAVRDAIASGAAISPADIDAWPWP